MKRAWSLALPLCIVPSLGCVVAAAAAAAGAVGYVQYDRNRAHRDFDAGFEDCWQAALGAADELGYPPPTILEHTPTEGELEAGTELWVRVEVHPEEFTCVAVRIGNFDTEDHRRRAGLFLNEVAERLGEEGSELD